MLRTVSEWRMVENLKGGLRDKRMRREDCAMRISNWKRVAMDRRDGEVRFGLYRPKRRGIASLTTYTIRRRIYDYSNCNIQLKLAKY